MAAANAPTTQRPWTIWALVAFSGAGLVWGLVSDQERNLWDIPMTLLSVWFTYAIWTGKRWVFPFMFMMTSLCAVAMLGVIVIQLLLFEQGLTGPWVWGLLSSGGLVALLMHPATKMFAGLDVEPKNSALTAEEPVR